jgi:hypothetical protein
MTSKMKTFGTVMLLSVAVATPAFAHSAKHRAYEHNFRRAYNQVVVPYSAPEFGFSGRDRSPVDGGNTWLHPGDINPSGS